MEDSKEEQLQKSMSLKVSESTSIEFVSFHLEELSADRGFRSIPTASRLTGQVGTSFGGTGQAMQVSQSFQSAPFNVSIFSEGFRSL